MQMQMEIKRVEEERGHTPHRSFSGIPSITLGTCAPQPDQVALPTQNNYQPPPNHHPYKTDDIDIRQLEHVVFKHIFLASRSYRKANLHCMASTMQLVLFFNEGEG
jgi:hypothetical protein